MKLYINIFLVFLSGLGMPMVAMDKAGAELQMSQANLPTTCNNDHPVTKLLLDEYFIFLGEKNLYAKGQTGIRSAQVLAEKGEKALKQARELVFRLIRARNEDRGLFETEKLKLDIEQGIKLEQQSQEHRQEIRKFSLELLNAQNTANYQYSIAQELELQKQNLQTQLDKSAARSVSLTTQRNMCGITLAACMASFLGYFLYIQLR